MRDGFDNPVIDTEGMTDELFAVTGDGRRPNPDAVAAEIVDFGKLCADNFDRIAAVGAVILIENAVVLADEGQLVVVLPQSMPRYAFPL